MARFLLHRLARRHLPPLKTLIPTRTYISEMRRSAFKQNLLRLLRSEIDSHSQTDSRPSPASFASSFSVEDRPGEQWIRLRRRHATSPEIAAEDVQIDATLIDGSVPSRRSPPPSIDGEDGGERRHISLIVEVSKGETASCVLSFICSAWPDALDVERVFPARRGHAEIRPYMGPEFRELDDELQDALREYLEERGINDDLAEFLHEYMANKDQIELVGWLRDVESYVTK